jgi:hypothetical protein
MHKIVGWSGGLPVIIRLGGTSQVEAVANQKLGRSTSFGAGPRSMTAMQSLFFHSVNIRSRIRSDPEFQWIGFYGYEIIEKLQELHRLVYGVPYPLWYDSTRSFKPAIHEFFGIIPIENDELKIEDHSLSSLTMDDRYLAVQQRSTVSRIILLS